MKSSAPFEVNVSSKYGAPMGRPSDPLESFEGARVQLRAVTLVDGDYDTGGAYWAGDTVRRSYGAHGERTRTVNRLWLTFALYFAMPRKHNSKAQPSTRSFAA
jgi:hypothetical protein